MLDFFGARMQAISLHVVGNKQRGEGVRLSKGTLDMDSEDTRDTLKNYFLKSFTSAELFRFTHASSLDLNEVYSYARDIFQGKGSFEESAVFIARHLYECSIHPKIQSGELFVVHFHDCVLEGKGMQALGIFKSELKERFIRTDIQNGSAIAGVFDGIDTKKLDRGCLILDTRDAEGYVVAHVDQLNKGNDTQFWMYDFLNIEPLQNDYHQTKQFLNLCQNFIVQGLPEKLETDKTAQIKMLQRSVDYFRNNESMELEQFVAEVFEEPKVIEEFKQFKTTYQEEREMPVYDSFDISNAAVKKQAKIFKSVIKLDKNFHIYVHGNNQWLERGFDEQRGMKYYKVFYQEEQ